MLGHSLLLSKQIGVGCCCCDHTRKQQSCPDSVSLASSHGTLHQQQPTAYREGCCGPTTGSLRLAIHKFYIEHAANDVSIPPVNSTGLYSKMPHDSDRTLLSNHSAAACISITALGICTSWQNVLKALPMRKKATFQLRSALSAVKKFRTLHVSTLPIRDQMDRECIISSAAR